MKKSKARRKPKISYRDESNEKTDLFDTEKSRERKQSEISAYTLRYFLDKKYDPNKD